MFAITQETVKELSNFEKWVDVGDLGIKFIGGLVIILGSWLSFREYANQRKKEAQDYQAQRQRELDQRAQELRMKVFDRELELYSRASTAASRIAVAADKGTKNEAAEQEFWELYWGPLCILETQAIESAMVDLGDALQRRDKTEKTADISQQNANAEKLKDLSYTLAQTIKAFLKTQYKVPTLKTDL